MIYDFRIFSISKFRVRAVMYPRTARIFKKRNGLYRLKNNTGILLDDIPFADMRAEGLPISSITEIERIITNRDCICDFTPPPDIPRIFDMTFDLTFE